jgi:HEAT repeat protein
MNNTSILVLLLITLCFQAETSPSRVYSQKDNATEIDALLRELMPKRSKGIVTSPSAETRQDVETRLTEIAQQSTKGRTEVIEALIGVVRDPAARAEWPVARRWIIAVNLLGDLRATESIDVLITNLDHTGENGVMSSINIVPVGRALEKIGEMAVPGLIQALGSDQEEISLQAARTLASIGRPALSALVDSLGGTRHSLKGKVALVLSWIGGREARQAIERAIEKEEDKQTRKQLNEALVEFRRRWADQN